MLAVVPQSSIRCLTARNLIAALTILFAGTVSESVCAAEQFCCEGKAFAHPQNFQDSTHNPNRLSEVALEVDRAGSPSQTLEREWREKLRLLFEEAGLGHPAALSYLDKLAATEKLGSLHPRILSIAENLGWFCCERLYRETGTRIIRLMNAAGEAVASPTAFAWALSKLAMLYKAQGRSEAAIGLLERALAIADRAPGKDYYREGAIANRLALYCGEAGRAGDAGAYFNRAIAAFEKSGDLASRAAALYNLALLYAGQRRYPEAADAALRSLSLLTETEKLDQSRVFDALNTLGGIYNALGRYKDAEKTLLRAFVIGQQNFKPADQRLSYVSANLAVIYKSEGRASEAVAMFGLALKAAEIALGPEDVWVGMIANRFAVTYFEQGRLTEAELLFKRAIAIGNKSTEEDSLFLAAALFNLSALYSRQWRYAEAEELLNRSLIIRRREYGPDHPAVEEVQNAIAAVQGAQKESGRSTHIIGKAFPPSDIGER